MKVFKGEKYSAQVSNSSSEMNSFNPENDIPIIDLGYCETKAILTVEDALKEVEKEKEKSKELLNTEIGEF